ncbi:MAG: hypothetical protein GWP61_25590 [Chloroflexi bacterium]|jgi:hypothetical protein|nr:hypothetical protein [Chloroflexota bacterium]
MLNCFSRGGSNILWNIFLSHPDACSPIYEILEIFRLDRKGVTIAGIQAAWLTRQLRFFNQWFLAQRRPISSQAQQFIDAMLFLKKLLTLDDAEMRFREKNSVYTRKQVEQARLVTKNNNGLAFLTDIWLVMYPDAVFFALTRDPLALYESHKRRKITRSPADFAAFYTSIVRKMQTDAARLPNYHLLKFESLLSEPAAVAQDLYALAGLDSSPVTKLRLKAKSYMQAGGKYDTQREQGVHYWLSSDEIKNFLSPDVNRRQIEQLVEAEIEELTERLGPVRQELGYG